MHAYVDTGRFQCYSSRQENIVQKKYTVAAEEYLNKVKINNYANI